MEEFTQKWAIVCLLEDVDEGSEFFYTLFPLHVTLAGVFSSDKNGQQLSKELETLLLGMQPVKIEADQKDMFGPNQDVSVMKVKKTPALMDLYGSVHKWLVDSKVVFNTPHYEGEGYLPHSTFQKMGALSEGEVRLINSVSLIDLYPDQDGLQRKIFKTISLKDL